MHQFEQRALPIPLYERVGVHLERCGFVHRGLASKQLAVYSDQSLRLPGRSWQRYHDLQFDSVYRSLFGAIHHWDTGDLHVPIYALQLVQCGHLHSGRAVGRPHQLRCTIPVPEFHGDCDHDLEPEFVYTRHVDGLQHG